MTTAALYAFPGVGEGPDRRPNTFEEYLTSIGLSEKTITTYLRRIDLARRQLEALGATLEEASAFELAELSAQTPLTHTARGQLRCALKHFYSHIDRTDAPLRAIRVPPQPRMVCKALEPAEAHALLEAAFGWWPQGAAVLLGLYLALRCEEIAKAEWHRFDADMEWYTVTGKRDKTATIPVHPVLRDELVARRGIGYLFTGRFGAYVNPATIWAWTKQVAYEAGIGDVRTHQLRHTSLTTALDNTENLRAVMEFARHERPQTTAGYTRTTQTQLRAVSDALTF